MRESIRKILKEETLSKPYKFSEGGYIIPSEMKDATMYLTDVEYKKLEPLNTNIKELYEAKKEHLKTFVLHNKGVIQQALINMRVEK